MLFNSIEFSFFLPIVFILYWFVTNRSLKAQNILIVVSSYIFYGWWDWRFLSLIFISTLVDYLVGRSLGQEMKQSRRKILLWISIIANLSFLGFFKYYNFFLENFVEAFTFLGYKIDSRPLSIVLPVGISFYTFQTMSYIIDVYRGKLKPTNDFISFMAFVSFFPQLVAGPIERATHLLPQFYKKREFKYSLAVDGCRQILWGLFKKIVIADTAATYVNMIFDNHQDYAGFTLVLGAVFFAFQIYGDFSGYSDIAIGTSRLFGFDLMKNFSFPYFSRSMAEFWRRWHISLNTWFRDYLYIPLGGSRGSKLMIIRNTFIIFLVSGFWHGANWTFIIWGGLNALYILPLILTNTNRNYTDTVAQGRYLPTLKEVVGMIVTFSLTVFAWIFFRAEDLTHALSYIDRIFSSGFLHIDRLDNIKSLLICLVFFFLVEWFGREGEYGLEKIGLKWNKWIRYAFYQVIIVFIIVMIKTENSDFIYFQF